MIRPLDRDTRGPARGSIAGSAPGPSRRITAASDTHLRPSRFRKDALTVHVTNHTKSRAPKTSPVLRSRRVASRVCSARRASPHESPATISWLGTRTWARACASPAPRRSRAPDRRERRRDASPPATTSPSLSSVRSLSPPRLARAPQLARAPRPCGAPARRTRGPRSPRFPSRPRGASRDARARGRRTRRTPRRRRRTASRRARRSARQARSGGTCGRSARTPRRTRRPRPRQNPAS